MEEDFGARVRRFRRDRGMTLKEVKPRGKSISWLSRLERGEIPDCSIPDMIEMAHNLKLVHPGVLLGIMDDQGRLLGQDDMVDAPITDEMLLARLGVEPASHEEALAIEEFTASARTGRDNLIPQNYDEMRPRKRQRKVAPKEEPHVFKVRVSGNCMHDTLRDGEVVWFDTLLPREPVAIVLAVRDEHEAHVKRLVSRDGALWLESDDGWDSPVDEHWRIVAVGVTAQRALPTG